MTTLWPSPKTNKGKEKMLEFEDGQSDGDESAHSLNREYGGLD